MDQEALSRALNKAQELGSYVGIRLAKDIPPLSHLSYADDMLIFGRARPQEVDNLAHIIRTYCSLAGLSLNDEKCSILWSPNTSDRSKARIAQALGMPLTTSIQVSFLVPIVNGKLKRVHCADLIRKIDAVLAGWKTRLLSQAGKVTFKNSTYFSSQVIISYVSLPVTCCCL